LGEAGSVGTELPVRVFVLSSIDFELTAFADISNEAGRRGNRENHGKISTTAEWFTERMMRFIRLDPLPHYIVLCMSTICKVLAVR
jgi:hypothetical protein